MEEHLFRIVQRNCQQYLLKHARAQQMDVFLHQEGKQLHLRMVDDGIGFYRKIGTIELWVENI